MIINEPEFNEYVKQGFNVIPIVKQINRFPDLAFTYEQFCRSVACSGLLESGRAGKYSYLPLRLIGTIRAKDGETELIWGENKEKKKGSPLQWFKEWIGKWHSPRLDKYDVPDWLGGVMGYFSYNMVQYFEELPDMADDDLQLPDLYFACYQDLIAWDHEQKSIYLVSNIFVEERETYQDGLDRLVELESRVKLLPDYKIANEPEKSGAALGEQPPSLSITPSFTKKAFMQAVEKVRQYIAAGDVFQVNISVRQDFPIHIAPWEVYRTLRLLNPSPYMGYFQFPEFQVVSGSPELLIKVKGQEASTRPIAGTRPRGRNEEEDLQLARELIENEKERAEHIMLVDLERNDLGRVCRFGSVEVSELMVIEKYSHVMHIVSHVRGRLAPGFTSLDTIPACFPGGTITGAPKVRTMEIIEELEPVKRGIYTGSMGWIGFNGDLELNIVIRTLLVKEGKGYVQAGAGIVIDSKPEAEYYESLKKAEAILKAVELSKRNMSRV